MSDQSTIQTYVVALADQLGVRYQHSPDDVLAEIVTRLSGDELVTDDIEDLIVALRRAGAISGADMVNLLSQYLNAKYGS